MMTISANLIALAPSGTLTLEQIALLPSVGVPALSAMRTLCADLPRGSKILVLGAEGGVGQLVLQFTQILRLRNDLWLTAQIFEDANSNVESICQHYGAREVIRNDPIAALNEVHEASFDVVFDTLGGRRIYDASRRVLHHDGLFVTSIGDELGKVSNKVKWNVGFKSLRRAFFKKDRKNVNYWFVFSLFVD